MIRAEGLSKWLGGKKVLHEVGFSVAPGQVVGLVGPNGAGKTTTLRVLAGYLDADEGRVEIGGRDVRRERAQAVAQLGYLPEESPLYREMRVGEYLRFRARLKGVPPSQIRARVEAVAGETGLAEDGRRLIATLSKGYRQRVGLADALLAAPPLLLLDEPTGGLDPVQMRAFRQLLVRLAPRHTVLLSSHLLSQVEAVCERMIILAGGRILADGTLARLRESLDLPEGASLEDVFLTVADRGATTLASPVLEQPGSGPPRRGDEDP